MRAFDPRAVGRRECGAWVAYYRRRWVRLLLYAVGMVRAGFGTSWMRTAQGAWLLLRACHLWAADTGNDPDGARLSMRRFYGLVARTHDERFDAAEAARLEVAWWRAHRECVRNRSPSAHRELIDGITELYGHVYQVPLDSVRFAATERAEAMAISDQWVLGGCDPNSPVLAREQAALVRSYAALLAAVHYPSDHRPR